VHGYSPWRTLLPRAWAPTIESDADELVIGAATASLDALGRHAYAVEAGWSSRARPDWQVAYAYDRWWPTIFAAYADDTDPFRAGEARLREIDAGVLLPIRRVRWTQQGLLAFHGSRDVIACAACDPAIDVDARLRSVRTGWSFVSAKSFGYSISAEQGSVLRGTTEWMRAALGADGDGGAWTADARHYRRAWPRHGVIAARAAAAGAWGDASVRREFTAAGNGPQFSGFDFDRDAVGLLRGFDTDDVRGTRTVVFNADYRVPLVRIDRGIGTLPLFVRALHAAAFIDAGHAWSDSFRRADMRVSIGGELSVDSVVGYVLPVTFSAGAAWRRSPADHDRGFVAFGRVGRAF
jgi:hypothetical protein